MDTTLPQNDDETKKAIFAFFRENFTNPAELLAYIDDDLNEGKTKFHKWQAEIQFNVLSKTYTSLDPLDLCLRAVNGSGKDEKVIAPFALWAIGYYETSRCVITSSSARQLDQQTERYISRFANAFNKKISRDFGLSKTIEFFIVQKRKIVCTFSDNSEILLFATDEEGQAEGYHPIKAGAVFIMIINEAKSIVEKLWESFIRCNGYTHWIEVSSPGRPDGHFYDKSTSTRTKSSGGPAIVQYIVTSDMCPHLGGEEYKLRLLETLKSVEHPLYKSMVNCDFSSTDEQVVIDFYKYNRLVRFQNLTEHYLDKHNKGGLDLAFGGDEIVLQVRNGNKHIAREVLRSKDTTTICSTIKNWFNKYGLAEKHNTVYADLGGLGTVIINLLITQYGCKNIIGIHNQWGASNETSYKNLGTEMWFSFASLIEEQEVILLEDDLTKKQLCNRYYKINQDNSAQLESKAQAKAKGHPSPDRADALVLCFHNYKTPGHIKQRSDKDKAKEEHRKLYSVRDERDNVEAMVDRKLESKKFPFQVSKLNNKSDLQQELTANWNRANNN